MPMFEIKNENFKFRQLKFILKSVFQENQNEIQKTKKIEFWVLVLSNLSPKSFLIKAKLRDQIRFEIFLIFLKFLQLKARK